MTTALLDRLTHHRENVETGNESWRFKNHAWKKRQPRWPAAAALYGDDAAPSQLSAKGGICGRLR